MQMVDVYIIGAQPAQAGFERPAQMVARGADVIRPVAKAKCCLGGDQRPVALAVQSLAQHLLRVAIGVNVRRVEEVDAGLQANVNQPSRFLYIGRAPCFEKIVATAKRTGTKTECGNFEAGASQQSIFHAALDAARGGRMQIPRIW